MRHLISSIAVRLTVWFLILSVFPLVVMAVFVRNNVAKELESNAREFRREQAQINATQFAHLDNNAENWQIFVVSSQPIQGAHLAVDLEGRIVAHPNPELIGRDLTLLGYSAISVESILVMPTGSFIDYGIGKVVGFARVHNKPVVDIVTIDVSAFLTALNRLTQLSFLQLALSLLVVSLAGGGVIWVLVGAPMRQLTHAAQALGKGEATSLLDPREMEDELSLLADTINQTSVQIQTLVSGLRERVSEVDRAYLSLRDSEERFRTIFDSVNDAIFVQELNSGAILDVNQKFSEMFRYTREEARHLTIGGLSSGESPYNHRTAMRMIRRTRTFGPQVMEWQVKDKFGRIFWAEWNMRIALLDGHERVLVVVRDIDERKRSEQLQIVVYRIFQVAQASSTLYEFFSLIHGILQTILPAQNFSVSFYEQKTGSFTFPYYFDERDTWPLVRNLEQGLFEHVMRRSESLLVTPETRPEWAQVFDWGDEIPFSYWLGAPLQTARGVLGVLVVKTYSLESPITAANQETFAFVSTQVALAVERKRAEDALRESEARWRTLMESAPQVVMTIDREGRVVFANRGLLSKQPVRPGKDTIFGYLPAETDEEKQKLLQKVFVQRDTLSFEVRTNTPEAHPAWFSCNLAPVIDQGRVSVAIFNASDITELKEAEAEIRASEELYRRAIEAAGAVPYYRDYATNSFQFMGAGILQMTGYEHTEIDPDLWNSLVDEAFLLGDAASLAYDDAVQMARDGRLRVWECDYRIHTRTGDERWIYESALELPGQDGISRSSIGILQDITARKQVEEALRQSETKFRSIVEQLTEGFSLLDEEGRILEWNRAQENITGLKRDEVSGQYFWEVEQRVLLPEHHHARYVRQHRALVERGLKTGRSIFFQKPIEAIILNTRGQKIHVQQISFPMRTEKGFRIGSLLRDVTGQKEAEAQLLRWSEELEQRVNERTIQLETANKELEAFSYSISHDLRAPLRAIDGFTRILSEEINSFASMENKRHLRVIRDNAQQMGRLIDDLLAFSRLGRQQINKTPLDTNEIIQQSLVILSSDIEGRHIQFDIPDLPVSWGDATLLKQVWVNLLSNAIKFTRLCSPAKIQLGFEQRDVDTIFLIRDNGVGFDIRYADKLFGVFQRLHRPEEYEGTGVGLAIVQRIVRRHGGDIWADSDIGKGATFYFRLPAG